MNKEKLSWGLILLFVGGILLLDNLNVINFYWRSVFSMWPIMLIVIGVNLLVPKRGIGPAVSIVVTVAALAFLAYWGTSSPRSNWWAFNNKSRNTERRSSDDRKHVESSKGNFTYDYDSTATTAYLYIKGGAVEYKIEGITDKLFSAEASSNMGSHELESTTNGGRIDLTFRMKSKEKGNWNVNMDENWAKISLNPNPAWNINLDMGAGTADFDLTNYKIASLNFKGGAASFEAKLGLPLEETVINAESGVASIKLEIPRNAACRIIVKSGLSSKDFSGFDKQGDGSYITEGYHAADHRFTINLQGGLSSFAVKRYDD